VIISSLRFVLTLAVSAFLSSAVAKRIGGRQKKWVAAVQKRVAITSSTLGSMKSVKMMGYSRIMSDIIQSQRIRELRHQRGFRWMIIWLNVIANLPFNLGPVATFVAYAIQAKVRGTDSLSTTQAFTSLALISLLTDPASQLLAAFPGTAAAAGCFQRIQVFLLTPSVEDKRIQPGTEISGQVTSTSEDIQLQVLRPSTADSSGNIAISLEEVNVRPSLKSELALKEISIKIRQASLTMIIGPVGSGKSTLLKAMLGELPCTSGWIRVSSPRMAYCAQTPWLRNCTIQECITGVDRGEAIDIQWYEKVLRACALEQDMADLTLGDQSIIGSRGITLSGGQKQRVALARAVYARPSIVLLDDVLSALDARTERLVVDRLFGKNGLLKQLKSTVVLVTHASKLSKST
jgi:ATP-binding cassette, subfamily C (CFTR/MRP), member 1